MPEIMTVVDEKGENVRAVDHYARDETGLMRPFPLLRDGEEIRWVYGDMRPHIFRVWDSSAEP